MKAFVAYSFNPKDAWIPELIFKLLDNLDIEYISGEELQGHDIWNGVEEKIISCDCLIAFLTKREQLQSGNWSTHPWVLQEITTANTRSKKIFPIYDKDVDRQYIASLQGKQITYFDESKKDELIVTMVGVLQRWKNESEKKKIKLLPEEMILEMKSALSRKEVKCFYRFMADSDELEEYQTEPIKVQGGYVIHVKNIPNRKDVFVNIRLNGPDNSRWASGYEPLDYVSFSFEKV